MKTEQENIELLYLKEYKHTHILKIIETLK